MTEKNDGDRYAIGGDEESASARAGAAAGAGPTAGSAEHRSDRCVRDHVGMALSRGGCRHRFALRVDGRAGRRRWPGDVAGHRSALPRGHARQRDRAAGRHHQRQDPDGALRPGPRPGRAPAPRRRARVGAGQAGRRNQTGRVAGAGGRGDAGLRRSAPPRAVGHRASGAPRGRRGLPAVVGPQPGDQAAGVVPARAAWRFTTPTAGPGPSAAERTRGSGGSPRWSTRRPSSWRPAWSRSRRCTTRWPRRDPTDS